MVGWLGGVGGVAGWFVALPGVAGWFGVVGGVVGWFVALPGGSAPESGLRH
ncbi:hypothetical protein Jiend_21400 [Micromonospora endophytica]|nr:hypothetical protein Jiend_21400 [Micromonospora endophytica]